MKTALTASLAPIIDTRTSKSSRRKEVGDKLQRLVRESTWISSDPSGIPGGADHYALAADLHLGVDRGSATRKEVLRLTLGELALEDRNETRTVDLVEIEVLIGSELLLPFMALCIANELELSRMQYSREPKTREEFESCCRRRKLRF